MINEQPKILVIRFSSIGDIVLTTPVIRCLKEQLNAEVHFLTKKSFAAVLGANPYLAKVWSINKKVSEVLPALKKERFSYIIDLHKNLRSWQVRFGLWQVKAFSFDKLNFQKWLRTRWKIDRLPDVHIVDRYLATCGSLGVVNDDKGLDYFIPDADQVNLESQGISKPYIALVIGAAHATKRLPQEKLIALCRNSDYPIVLLGGPSDQASGEAIALAGGPTTTNLCGKLRLHQSADVVRQAACVITHDTGLMHIAAAFGKPILSIWGNTIPSFGMYPYLPDSEIQHTAFEVTGLNCRPCSKIGFQECPKGHFNCMQQQNVNSISTQANHILKAAFQDGHNA